MAQVQALLEELLEKLPDEFNVAELVARAEERSPYTVVAVQECERMNALTAELRRSLSELELGLKVGPCTPCPGHRRAHREGLLLAAHPAGLHRAPSRVCSGTVSLGGGTHSTAAFWGQGTSTSGHPRLWHSNSRALTR